MSIQQVKVFVNELAEGMYVSALDKPWADTPFPLQGFLIRDHADIKRIKAYCDYVYIDVQKGRGPIERDQLKFTAMSTGNDKGKGGHTVGGPASGSDKKELPNFEVKLHTYTKSVSLAQEIPMARRAVNNMIGCLTLATRQIARGVEINVEQLTSSVDAMVDSVLRCPDAFTWLMRLRAKDSATHDHSIRSALWAVQFGRHIGLEKQQIADLCLAAMLKDVGKIKLPRAILHKRKRTAEEEAEYRTFIRHSVEMLTKSGFDNRNVLQIIKFHREYYDGSGFPKGLGGKKIPILANVVGIATTFDLLSHPELDKPGMSPSKATNQLYGMRNKLYPADLVVEFIQSIGIYPPGTMVELSTGQLGVVTEQDPRARLSPRIAVFENKGPQSADANYVAIDLKDEQKSRRILSSFGAPEAMRVAKLSINRDLEPEEYPVDSELMAQLIAQNFAKTANDLGIEGAKKDKGGLFASLRERFIG